MELTLSLSVEEINLVLEGLRELQFKKVISCIKKIEDQATSQLQKSNPTIQEPIEE